MTLLAAIPLTVVPWWLGARLPTRVAVGIALAVLAAEAALQPLDLWDALLISLAILLGAVAPRPPRGAVGQVALFFALAEIGARVALPAPPLFTDEDEPDVRFRNRIRHGEAACALADPASREWAERAPTDRPAVLHLGDSMLVFAPGDPVSSGTAPDRFPALLGAGDPGRTHVNLGVPGTSYDMWPLWVDAAVARGPVDQVVLYLFLNNDLGELGRPYPCCPGGVLGEQGVVCHPPPFDDAPWSRLIRRSRPPLLLRALSAHSALVAHLRVRALAWTPLLTGVRDADDDRLPASGPEVEALWAQARVAWTATRDRARAAGARVTAVIVPIGRDLPRAADAPAASSVARQARAAALCAELGIPVLDANAAMATIPPDPGWFMPDGYHLSQAGHARLAAWLAPRLTPP